MSNFIWPISPPRDSRGYVALHNPCRLEGHKGDKIRSGYINPPFSGCPKEGGTAT